LVGARHLRRLTVELHRIGDCVWEIPRHGGMRVSGRIYASEKLMGGLRDDPALTQVANVAHLPGIVGHSLAMPDIHWGYGFPIGGVAAVDAEEGAISPGGIGFDVNCGVRLLRTGLAADDLAPHLARLADALYQAIPAGVGSAGAIPRLTQAEEKKMLARGAAWAVANQFGRASDLEATEEGGCMRDADPDAVSDTALERGRSQVGTLGSGNHFLEVQRVDEVFDARAASALGVHVGQLAVMIHSGSRGLGYQVCDDALRTMGPAMARYGITMPDRQLACVPLRSPEGRQYLAAMAAAANFAWTNRQVMSGLAERAFGAALGLGPAALRFALVYDVCHNIAKLEEHVVDGRPRRVCVHRKGATRAFGPGHPALPAHLRPLGQPVIIPGDMGRYSFLLLGTAGAMAETFGSTCHGAGRLMSRAQAKKMGRGLDLVAELAGRGVVVRAQSLRGVAEEMPWAYKDVADVVDVVDRAGIARRVARLRPLVVVKG
jgi:tRNA-splicing ligase RtcB